MRLQLIFVLGLALSANAALIEVYDEDINAGETVHWTADNTYLMKEKVFVEDGALLIIDPGVVVKSEPHPGSQAVALIITRGGKIHADGTAESPIVFTSIADDLLPYDQTALDVPNTTGLWGGVVILGNAVTNLAGGFGGVEGVDITDDRGQYGGTDDDDSSGVLRYVSIRFAGQEVMPDVELNGLTMGAVGSRTVIEYVEVFNNADDAFEWFGGSVNTRYLLAVNCQDDGFDYDVGFRGRGQFWCCVHGNPGPDSRCGEHDGAVSPIDAPPYSIPVIANATYIAKNDQIGTIMFRENAGGKYLNSIFHDAGDVFVKSEFAIDAEERFLAGDLMIADCIFWSAANPSSWSYYDPFSGPATDALDAGRNIIYDPGLNCRTPRNYLKSPSGRLDFRPTADTVFTNITCADSVDTSGFIESVCFKGAFDPTQPMWVRGWTAFDHYGYLKAPGETPVASIPTDCCNPVKTAPAEIRSPAFTSCAAQLRATDNRLLVSCRASKGSRVSVTAFDMRGKLVAHAENVAVRTGMQLVPVHINAKALQALVYHVSIDGVQVLSTRALPK
ncbi:MAG: T9SS C-terminal target domain-containing protein [Chitinivibrionales bacterium]|nr:T9SS C-terminal target domain-containing protein [Chitinivibrionales bacterium]